MDGQKIWKALTTKECYGYREAGELMEEIRKPPQDIQSARTLGRNADKLSIEEKYYDLIMCVTSKYPGETRHETAKRYILNAEELSECNAKANIE